MSHVLFCHEQEGVKLFFHDGAWGRGSDKGKKVSGWIIKSKLIPFPKDMD